MCSIPHMATNLAIDDDLLNEALSVGGLRTKKATVTKRWSSSFNAVSNSE